MSVFEGFPKEGLEFLRELGTQDKAWFDSHRGVYQDAVVRPTKAFVVALGERLGQEVSAAIVAEPKTNGSIAPINNDLRFSPDRDPYKDHLLLKFWEGPDKKTAPTLHLRLSPVAVGFATGAALPDLDRWRERVADERTGLALAAALDGLAAGRDLEIVGEGYKRVPKPYPADHPRAGLLRHRYLQARWPEPLPASVHSAGFVDHCIAQLSACSDVHRWLVANL